jgi:hypothetical protein
MGPFMSIDKDKGHHGCSEIRPKFILFLHIPEYSPMQIYFISDMPTPVTPPAHAAQAMQSTPNLLTKSRRVEASS